MPVERPKLSLTEKVDLIPALLSVAFAALSGAVVWPFRSSARESTTYYHYIIHSLVRQFSLRLSVTQAQWVETPFVDAYKTWCRDRGLKESVVQISDRTDAFWIGDESSSYVMIYFHGGGFAFGGNSGHLDFWESVRQDLASRSISLAILFVAYPLMPSVTFPGQFDEAVKAVRYAHETLQLPPSRLILGGDSAGGNLVLAALLHATHDSGLALPLSGVVKAEKFKAAVLMSPWVSFDVSAPSFESNKYKDYLHAESEKRWGNMYLGRKAPSPYSEPATADDMLWKDLPVQSVLVTAGSNEALIDGLNRWVKTFKVSSVTTWEGDKSLVNFWKANAAQAYNSNVTYSVGINEPHEAPIIWSVFGDRHETETGKNIRIWLREVLEPT